MVVEDDPYKFAQKVLELISNEDLRKEIATNSLKFIRKNYSWEKAGRRLEKVYRGALKEKANIRY